VVVSVAVGFRYMPNLRHGRFLVIGRSRKLTLLLDTKVGVSWILLWTELTYFSTPSGSVRVLSYIRRMSSTY
jgi:hypothetical protein